ncbi:MAG: hypothetical protein HY302_10605 [Opitutae bacterium]|nr:hypothetical protein [Opitutae bacterium]
MKVRLPIVEQVGGTMRFDITSRVEVDCELIEAPDGTFLRIRLLAAGAGLPSAAEITVPASEIVPD